jgi:hypothetical protein
VHRLASLGHKNITYVSFTKSAVGDAQRRFNSAIVNCSVNCRTLNALAWSVGIRTEGDLPSDDDTNVIAMGAAAEEEDQEDIAPSLIDDGDLEDLIRTSLCRTEIAHFLQGVGDHDLARVTKRVTRFIFKTFESFCKGPLSVQRGYDAKRRYPSACYFPALLYHKGKSGFLAPGVPQWQESPANIEPFYVGCAKKVWDHCMSKRLYTYLSSVKFVQLQDTVIPGTALVLDEAQDTNPCALAWIVQQRTRMQVFLVGDLAQCIFSFTGAKPQV